MKVVFDISAGRVAIEGDAPELLKVLETARNLAPNISQIQIITSHVTAREMAALPVTESRDSQGDAKLLVDPSKMTLRQFARELSLNNASERIATIAYYVNKIEGKQSFSPKEMDGWFTMCGFQKPSQMPVALFDAQRKYGYVENVARGSWKISTQGENLIARRLEGGE